jgi:hypothetical protein
MRIIRFSMCKIEARPTFRLSIYYQYIKLIKNLLFNDNQKHQYLIKEQNIRICGILI